MLFLISLLCSFLPIFSVIFEFDKFLWEDWRMMEKRMHDGFRNNRLRLTFRLQFTLTPLWQIYSIIKNGVKFSVSSCLSTSYLLLRPLFDFLFIILLSLIFPNFNSFYKTRFKILGVHLIINKKYTKKNLTEIKRSLHNRSVVLTHLQCL